MVWEHKHIAHSELNSSGDTLWSLLNLGAIGHCAVPPTWEDMNYNFFWIIDHEGDRPTFVSVPQQYRAHEYAELPDNAWGAPIHRAKFPKFHEHCVP